MLQIAECNGTKLIQRQILQIRIGLIEILSQNITIDRRGQQFSADSLCEFLPQFRGRNIHHIGNGQRKDPCLRICFFQIFSLNGKKLLAVLFRSTESGNAGQRQNLVRVLPCLQRQEHIGSHQQPEFILRILFFQNGQRIRGETPPFPLQFHIQNLHPIAKSQLLTRKTGHLQPLVCGCTALRHFFMGRNSGRDQQQLIQTEHMKPRFCRSDMPQVRRVEGPAVNTDLHY